MTNFDHHGLAVEHRGDVTVARFQIARLLKEGTVEIIGEQLFALVDNEGRRRLILDFGRVERVYSVMLGKIAALHQKLEAAGGHLALCQLHPDVYEVFLALGLHKVLDIYDDEKQALEAVGAPA
ncbi:MAG TPA: STAS domain-containing protein [Gemmataceae bacterium]|nr:STAS domain-containing protein [Gemmataceae bacterium]